MSIFEIFQQVTDKRNSRGKMYPLYSVLSLILLSNQQLSNVGGGEISSAIELLSQIKLKGLVLTGDAMFCNEQICQTIIDNKGNLF